MTLALAFLGGLISCLSPCVVPVIPVFLANVLRPAVPVLAGAGIAAWTPARPRAIAFLMGFAGVFVALWVSLGLVGYAVIQVVPDVRVPAGAAIMGLGIAVIAGWRPRFAFGRWGRAGSIGGSFLLGAGVAVGWTPCIGPTLGAILTLAAASDTVWSGGALLVAYAVGMSVPFVVIGFGATRIAAVARVLSRHPRLVEMASGTFIVLIGALVATNTFSRLAGLISWTF